MTLDFTKMQYNPMAVPKGKTMLEQYPALEFYNQTGDFNCDDCLVRYASLICDLASPLTEAKDYGIMVSEAMRLAEVPKGSEKGILDGNNIEALRAINRFFMIFNNDVYTYWYTLKQGYYQNTTFLQTPADYNSSKYVDELKKRQEISQKLKDDLNVIGQLESSIFSNNAIRKAVTAAAASTMMNYAEKFAEKGGI